MAIHMALLLAGGQEGTGERGLDIVALGYYLQPRRSILLELDLTKSTQLIYNMRS